jgi:hypothetical protein
MVLQEDNGERGRRLELERNEEERDGSVDRDSEREVTSGSKLAAI